MKTPCVAPSDIVRFIDQALPAAAKNERFSLDHSHSPFVQSLLVLVDRLDPLILPASGDDLLCFQVAVAAIRNVVEQWTSRGAVASIKPRTPGFGDVNPVSHIRRILAATPDSAVPAETEGLEFVRDEDYRRSLRTDVASVEELIRVQQWKAAMVVTGSLMEALFLDQLLELGTARVVAAIEKLDIKERDLTRWHLPAYARVACECELIKKSTCEQVLLGGDFRNLVHPGKAIREGAVCSRGTAVSTAGALFLLIEDLSRRVRVPSPAKAG